MHDRGPPWAANCSPTTANPACASAPSPNPAERPRPARWGAPPSRRDAIQAARARPVVPTGTQQSGKRWLRRCRGRRVALAFRRCGLIVQKYGGTSVANLDRIREVSRRVAGARAEGHGLVVVVSAMAGETNRLLKLGAELAGRQRRAKWTPWPPPGSRSPRRCLPSRCRTQGPRPLAARPPGQDPHRRCLHQGPHPIDRGQQPDQGRRGWPSGGRRWLSGRRRDRQHHDPGPWRLRYDRRGAGRGRTRRCLRDLHRRRRRLHGRPPTSARTRARFPVSATKRCWRWRRSAPRYADPFGGGGHEVRSPGARASSFSDAPGTWVVGEDADFESVVVSGVTSDKNETKITLRAVPDQPGVVARVFEPCRGADLGGHDHPERI